jgi:hypothetical protein
MRRDESSRMTFSRVSMALGEIAGAHLLVAERGAEERLAGFEGETFFDFVGGQLELVLILIDAGAVVVDHCGVGGVHAERGIELIEGLVVHAIDAKGDAGDHADVPVVACGLEEVFDAVAGGLFFATGEEHVDAIEIGFDRAGVEGEGFVEGSAGFEDVHLATEAVARVLEMGDAEAGPGGGVVLILRDDGGKELAGAIEVFAAAGAGHEGGEDGAGLQVLLGEGLIQRDCGG